MNGQIALAFNAAAYVSSLGTTLGNALLRLDFHASPLCLIQVLLHLRRLWLLPRLCLVGHGFIARLLNILANLPALFPLLLSSSLGASNLATHGARVHRH